MNDNAASTSAATWRDRWLSPRRKRFWAIVALIAYTLFGFFALPVIVEKQTVGYFRDTLGREARIANIDSNPFLLTMRVEGFELDDTDGERLASFDRLFVDFQLSSLFNWAWTFKNITLDGGRLLEERFAPGDTRLTRLIGDLPEDEEEQASDEGGLPRLVIHEIRVADAGATLIDRVPGETVTLHPGPIGVGINGLDTRPDRSGNQAVNIEFGRGGTVSWQGDLSLVPFESNGRLELRGLQGEYLGPYVKDLLPIDDVSFAASADLHYTVSLDAAGTPLLVVDELRANVDELSVTAYEPVIEFLAVPGIELTGGRFEYPSMNTRFELVTVTAPVLTTWLNPDASIALLELLPADDGEEPGQPFPVTVAAIDVSDAQINFEDRTLEPAAPLDIAALNARLEGVDLVDGTQMPARLDGALEAGGEFTFDGLLTMFPDLVIDGDVTTTAIATALAEPYIRGIANVGIEAGTLDLAGTFRSAPEELLHYTGSVGFDGLEVSDQLLDEQLVGWQRLAIDRFDLQLDANAVTTSQVRITEPFGRLVIAEDKSTNVGDLLVEDTAGESEDSAPMSLEVGGLLIENGELAFADLSLPLPFSTQISQLGGEVGSIVTGSSEPAAVSLEGQVGEFGLARISGDTNAWDPLAYTDITMEFRNLEIPEYSPYTVEFAGRKIANGRLDLDLVYRINEGQLQGDNDIVMRDLELGEKVESPNAVNLPLGLAVALLKDSEGVIDIALPVEGDVNDPEFKIGGVVWQAFVGFITRIATAPFRALGALIGVDSEDFGQLEFLAGRADLTPPQLEMIGQLAEALRQRPELIVEVRGAWDPAIDGPALKAEKLRQTVIERLGLSDEEALDATILDERIVEVGESLFLEYSTQQELDALIAEYSAPPADDPEGDPVLDELAFYEAVRQRLVELQPLSEADFRALADARAGAAQAALLETGGLPPERVQLGEPEAVESEDEDWVTMELGVVAD